MGKRFLAVAVTSCVLGAGLVSLAGAAVQPVPKDVCTIVTEADVGEAFGFAATQGESGAKKGEFSFCNWEFPIDLTYTDDDGATVTLTGTGTFGVSCNRLTSTKGFKGERKASTAEKISGLKKSFFDTTQNTVKFILTGKTVCNVQYGGPELPDPAVVKDALITLAKQVAKKGRARASSSS